MSITLLSGDLSVVLVRFAEPRFPRVKTGELPTLEYAVSGNAIGRGAAYESPHIWSISCFCFLEQVRTLGAMYAQFDEARKDNSANEEIILIDRVQEIHSYISYFAQFLVWFASEPQFEKAGAKYLVNLSFQETRKLVL